jgi:elongation factor Ts
VALKATKEGADLAELAKNVCMHIVFAKPSVMSRDEIPDDVQEKEREIAVAQVDQDPKMANKPAQVREKVVEGKLAAFFREQVLPEQEWSVDQSLKATVAEVVRQHGAEILAFRRFQIGA